MCKFSAFLNATKIQNYFKRLNLFLSSQITATIVNFDYNLKFHLQFILVMAEKRPANISNERLF